MSSIRSRLLLWQIGALVVTSLLVSALSYNMAWQAFNRLRDYGLEQIAYSVMRHDTQEWLEGAGDGGDAADEDDTSDDRGQFISQIWTLDGKAIYTSVDDTGPPLQPLGLHRPRWGGNEWRTFTLRDGDRLIQVASTSEHRWQAFLDFAPWLLLPLGLLITLLTVLIGATVTRALQPLERLRGELAQRVPSALGPVSDQGMPDEVRPLVNTLNHLLGKVGDLLHAQRDFLADVAHELNTPLAAIKLQAQLAQRAQAAGQPVALADLQAGIERAIHLVAQLLQMARLEPDAHQTPSAWVNLTPLAQARVTAFSALADERQIDLGLEAEAAVTVLGDANAWGAALDNLIDNALRYCPSGARVDVRLRREGDHGVLEVVDNGPGIADVDKPTALARFARLRPNDTTGSGLGLAIVRQVAAQHQADLQLLDTPGGGLTVALRWPTA